MNIPGKYLAAGIVLLVIGLIAGGIIGAVVSSGTTDEAEIASDIAKIQEVWNEYEASVSAEDSERWIALWIEDGIQMPPDEPRHIGKEQIFIANQPGFDLFDFEDFNINPSGIEILGTRAYSHGTYGFSMTPKDGGDTVDVSGKFLTILEKQGDGSWKLAIDIFNYSPSE